MYPLIFSMLLVPPMPTPGQSDAEATQNQQQTSPQLDEAARLYNIGTVQYEANDYDGAIKSFVAALAIVQESEEADEQIQKTLLYNIGTAHEKAFEIDRDLKHLRQALRLYRKYESFIAWQGVSKASEDATKNHEEVKRRIKVIEAKLRAADIIQRGQQNSDIPPPVALGKSKKFNRLGIGLTASGAASLITGAIMLGVGSQYKGNAEDEVDKLNDLGVPMDHPAWAEGNRFIQQETTKGRALMAGGGVLAGLGVIGAAVGVYFITKSGNRRAQGSIAASPTFVGIHLTNHF